MSLERELNEALLGEVRERARSVRGVVDNLRLGLRLELAPVDAEALVDEAGGAHPDCEACQDTCCRGAENRITLRLSDLARLIDHGYAWAVDREKETPDEVYARFPDLRDRELLDSNRRLPALSQDDDGRCVLLGKDGRCQIYELRPLRCRRFPYRLADDKQRVTYSARCQSRRPATDDERRDLIAAVARNYNEKLKDALLFAHGRAVLARTGIARHLPVVE